MQEKKNICQDFGEKFDAKMKWDKWLSYIDWQPKVPMFKWRKKEKIITSALLIKQTRALHFIRCIFGGQKKTICASWISVCLRWFFSFKAKCKQRHFVSGKDAASIFCCTCWQFLLLLYLDPLKPLNSQPTQSIQLDSLKKARKYNSFRRQAIWWTMECRAKIYNNVIWQKNNAQQYLWVVSPSYASIFVIFPSDVDQKLRYFCILIETHWCSFCATDTFNLVVCGDCAPECRCYGLSFQFRIM